jgi:putative ABC transport system permease protein
MVWRPSAAKLYRTLLLAYPAEFRHEYGAEMQRLFAGRIASEPAWRVWLETVADVAFTAPSEHLHILAADLRHGARMFARSPGLAATALLAIALGIGATTAVFSLVNAVLIRSLPYGDAARLVYIWTPNLRLESAPRQIPPSAGDFFVWRRTSRSFSGLTMFEQVAFNLTSTEAATRIGGARVLGNFFGVIEVRPEIGRVIDANDDRPGHEKVAVISDALWHSQFGGDPGVLGRTVRLNRDRYRVIGVMPPDFLYPRHSDFPYASPDVTRTDVWVPFGLTAKQKANLLDNRNGNALGRLRPGVTIKQAQAEMTTIEARLNRLYPAAWAGWTAYVASFTDSIVGRVRTMLWLLFGAVLLVLLIASSNVASLLLARAAGRVHEMGIRSALGADRSRLIRQTLTESLVLAAAGGALGVALAYGAIRLLLALNPGNIPRLDETTLDGRVLLFTFALSLATGLLFGILPALSASKVNVNDLLRQGASRGIAGARGRSRELLMAGEIALAVVLLAGAGLLIRSYLNLQAVNPGFAESALTMNLRLDARYTTLPQRAEFDRALIGRIAGLPGVKAAGAVSAAPLTGHEELGWFQVDGYPNQPNQAVDVRSATAGYFNAIGIRLVEGQLFHDDAGPGMTAVVNQSFERKYFGGRSAVGGHIRFDARGKWITIAGVVGDVRHSSMDSAPSPTVYSPLLPAPGYNIDIAVRAAAPGTLAPAIRAVLRSLDPGLALADIRTMSERVAASDSRRRFQTVVLSVFAGIAVFLALIGLYGLMSYSVRQRTREIGVRMAMGASRSDVLRMILRQGLTLTIAGLAAGLACAFALMRLIESWLYAVKPSDPATFAVVPVLILLVSAGACLMPGWKATRVDPAEALRYE